jgi:hypothetical protein
MSIVSSKHHHAGFHFGVLRMSAFFKDTYRDISTCSQLDPMSFKRALDWGCALNFAITYPNGRESGFEDRDKNAESYLRTACSPCDQIKFLTGFRLSPLLSLVLLLTWSAPLLVILRTPPNTR